MTILPGQIRAAVPKDYTVRSTVIVIAGTIAKNGDAYTLTARGSKKEYSLRPNDDVKKLAGKAAVVTGKYAHPDEKKPPVIEVTSAKEPK